MAKEEYVSYKVAKLLKKKGFDGYCFKVYDIGGTVNDAMELYGETEVCNSDCSEGDIAAPTLQDAVRWLREQHKLLISINPALDKDGQLCICTTSGTWTTLKKKQKKVVYIQLRTITNVLMLQ